MPAVKSFINEKSDCHFPFHRRKGDHIYKFMLGKTLSSIEIIPVFNHSDYQKTAQFKQSQYLIFQ